MDECEMSSAVLEGPTSSNACARCCNRAITRPPHDFDLASVSQIGERQRASLSRFVADVERLAYDEDDCEGVQAELSRGLKWVAETRRAHRDDTDAMGTAERVKGILARPEFIPSAPERADGRGEARREGPPSELRQMVERNAQALLGVAGWSVTARHLASLIERRDCAGSGVVMHRDRCCAGVGGTAGGPAGVHGFQPRTDADSAKCTGR